MSFIKNIKFFFIQGMVKEGLLYKADRLFKIVLKNLFIALKIKGLNVVAHAVKNVRIFFAFKRYYKGGAAYFIPIVITNLSENRNAVKCLLKHSHKKGQSIFVTLMSELLLAKELKGDTIKYKNDFNIRVIKGIPFLRFLRKKIKK